MHQYMSGTLRVALMFRFLIIRAFSRAVGEDVAVAAAPCAEVSTNRTTSGLACQMGGDRWLQYTEVDTEHPYSSIMLSVTVGGGGMCHAESHSLPGC